MHRSAEVSTTRSPSRRGGWQRDAAEKPTALYSCTRWCVCCGEESQPMRVRPFEPVLLHQSLHGCLIAARPPPMGGLRDASPTPARVSDDISPRPPGRAAATWPRNTRRSRWGRRGSRRAASPPSSRTMRGAAGAHHGQPARADRARSGPALVSSGIGYPEHQPLCA